MERHSKRHSCAFYTPSSVKPSGILRLGIIRRQHPVPEAIRNAEKLHIRKGKHRSAGARK
jgi:hypothetical protein